MGPLPVPDGGIIETIYWLAAGESRLRVESKIVEGDSQVSIADVADWGSASWIIAENNGRSTGGTGRFHDVKWYVAGAGKQAISSGVFGGEMRGYFVSRRTRVESFRAVGDQRIPFHTRWLFFSDNDFSGATDPVFHQASDAYPIGVFEGQVLQIEEETGVPDSWVTVYWYDREKGPLERKVCTRIRADSEGKYRAVLPVGRYFVAAGSRSRLSAWPKGVATGIVVEEGKVARMNLYLTRPATLKLQVVDMKTQRPMAARVRLDPIQPDTPKMFFESFDNARGYYDSLYIPPEGTTFELFQGRWTLTFTHGISYDIAEFEVNLRWAYENTLRVELPEVSPTPGWFGMEIGAMTRATPRSALSAEDIVLMSAGEGLHWIVSGDWETITDFAPAIEALRLRDQLGSSRGFRTWLPAHPDWGTFLLYPVAPDAPDPKDVRDQWKDLESASEFLSVLRQLYPGALIEVVNPFSGKDGYFYMPNKNVHQLAARPRPDIDLSVDAVNLFDPRGLWKFDDQSDFFFVNTLSSRVYIPAPVSSTEIALSSEPGYPRLLVRTGHSDVKDLTEQELFAALRAGQWQITTGPFIDFTVGGRREGEFFESGKETQGHLRITAPSWAGTTRIDLVKEGVMEWMRGARQGTDDPVRFDEEFLLKLRPHEKAGKDTEISIFINGSGTLERFLPAFGKGRLQSMALTAPVFADNNGDGRWDPPLYMHMGQ